MICSRFISVVTAVVCVSSVAHGEQLRVPQDYSTIQAAVDAAGAGAVIVVGPGQYYENVSIMKSIALIAPSGSTQTVIDGRQLGPVIVAVGTGSEEVRIEGFTLTNGLHTFAMLNTPGAGDGGALYLESVDAIVRDNVIRGNTACLGTGISTLTATVTIEYNEIVDNRQDPSCFFVDGGGIMFRGDGVHPSVIASNTIAGHIVGGGGAGIAVQGADRITIEGNTIRDNQAYSTGGGILMNIAGGVIRNNVLLRNTAETGGGMDLAPIDNSNRLRVQGNTLFGNQATGSASSIHLLSVTRNGLRLVENTVTGASAVALVRCETPFEMSPSNVLLNSAGPTTAGGCELRH